MLAEILLNGDITSSAAVDNNPATATLTVPKGQRGFIGGIEAHYSAAVAAIKNIVLTRTVAGASVTKTYVWDFSRGPFVHNFPLIVHGDYGTNVTVALDASGTGGTTGQVSFWAALV